MVEQTASGPGLTEGPPRQNCWLLLSVLLLLEAGVFAGIAAQGAATFLRVVERDDTPTYVAVAQGLLKDHALVPGIRTLGYPLLLCAALWAGGATYYPHVVVGVQLALNLVLACVFWGFLGRSAPGTRRGTRLLLTGAFCWAGWGMGMVLLSDFLAGFFFAVSLYGMLLKRTWAWAVLGGGCLGLANITRPTFTFYVVLIPVVAWLAGRVGSRLRPAQVAVYIAFWAASLGLNLFQDHVSRDRRDTAIATGADRTFLTHELYDIHKAYFPSGLQSPGGMEGFRAEIARRTGRPFEELTRSDREAAARAVVLDEVWRDPGPFLRRCLTSLALNLGWPSEGPLSLLRTWKGPVEHTYAACRPFVLWPLWGTMLLLCLWPPAGDKGFLTSCYPAAVLVLAYLVGLSAALSPGGERMRYPGYLLLLPIAGLNWESVRRAIRRRLGRVDARPAGPGRDGLLRGP